MALACNIEIEGQEASKCVLLPHALYLLPDRRAADASFELVWCDGCNELTAGELLDLPDSVKARLDAGKNGTLPREWKALVASDEDYLRRWLYGLQQTIAFLEIRKSLPRCLECGGKNIQPMYNEKSDMTTLPNGDRCTLSYSIASTSVCNRLKVLSLDGEVLGEIGRYDINGNKIDCQFPYRILMEIVEDAGIVT